MQTFIKQPSIDRYPGIRVTKETTLDFENANARQTLENLVFHSVAKAHGENFDGVYDITIRLQEGDILIYDEDRGYIKPVETFMTVGEAIEEMQCIADLG